jgi:hypothetical protein
MPADSPGWMSYLYDHPYLAWYLVGCVFVIALTLAKLTLWWALTWATKGNVLAANLRKLHAPAAKVGWVTATMKFVRTVVFEAVLSWINVVAILWQMAMMLLRTTREALTPVPESIKELRFPLRCNPDLPTESVWAHMVALSIKGEGLTADEEQLTTSLDDVTAERPRFDRIAALRCLEMLQAVKPAVLSAVIDQNTKSAKDANHDDL